MTRYHWVSLLVDVCVWTYCTNKQASRMNRTAIIWGYEEEEMCPYPRNERATINKNAEGCETVWVDSSHVINPWVSEVVDDDQVWSFSILSCCCGDGVHSTEYNNNHIYLERLSNEWALESSPGISYLMNIGYNDFVKGGDESTVYSWC